MVLNIQPKGVIILPNSNNEKKKQQKKRFHSNLNAFACIINFDLKCYSNVFMLSLQHDKNVFKYFANVNTVWHWRSKQREQMFWFDFYFYFFFSFFLFQSIFCLHSLVTIKKIFFSFSFFVFRCHLYTIDNIFFTFLLYKCFHLLFVASSAKENKKFN